MFIAGCSERGRNRAASDWIRASVNLSRFKHEVFDRGRPVWLEALWLLAQALVVNSWIPGSTHRALILRLFGAKIGSGVVLKPNLRVKFPWRLSVGNNVWLGESVWIDNLARVTIGNNVCVSQGAYLCTGSHDWLSTTFDLIVRPIEIGDQAWICANASLAPGTRVGEGAVVSLCATVSGDIESWHIYAGSPAVKVRPRQVLDTAPENNL